MSSEKKCDILDLVFAIDCTSSMAAYIRSALECIRSVVQQIRRCDNCNLQLGLIEFRDHYPEEETFVTRVHGPTRSTTKMKQWLEDCNAKGGGDTPEAVADAMHEVTKFDWREDACKVCLLILDAPPHGLDTKGIVDNFPKGCPENHDPMQLARVMAKMEISLYAIGCEPLINPYRDFYASLAYLTGAQYIPLQSADCLPKLIVGTAAHELSLAKLMPIVEKEVTKELESGNNDVSNNSYYRRLTLEMKRQHLTSDNLKISKVTRPSKKSVEMRHYDSLNAVQARFSPARGGSLPVRLGMYDVVKENITRDVVEKMVQRAKARSLKSVRIC